MPALPESPHQRQIAAREHERAAVDHLSRVTGALGLQAAVLALLLPVGHGAAARTWQVESAACPGAALLREHVEALSPAARLPWLDMLLLRMRGQKLATRRALLAATRRVMSARGFVRPIDRLHWLLMRQRLGESSAAAVHSAALADLSRLPPGDVLAVARYSAFLSRMVPAGADDDPRAPGASANTPAGAAWYATAMARWQRHEPVPPCEPPDTEGLVHALQELQALAWMQRPVIARDWVTAAFQHSPHGRLEHGAADALRLSCLLLDSPLPPPLERHYRSATPGMPP